jgi:aldose 1-epimerase
MYSGNYMNGSDKGKNGTPYISRSAVCLEPQVCPNGLNHPHFPSPILKKDEEYIYSSIYKFL